MKTVEHVVEALICLALATAFLYFVIHAAVAALKGWL